MEDEKPITIELKKEGAETKPGKNDQQAKENLHLDDQKITITSPEKSILQETANHLDLPKLNNYSDEVLNDFQKILENIRISADVDTFNIIGIVSPIHKQGTSTIARILSLVASGSDISNENENLAICSNNTSPKRILLIDTQLRASELHKQFEISTDFGLMDFLTKNISIDECITKIPNSNLNIITSGNCSHYNRNPNGFEKLKTALEKIRDQFDLVLMDLPPILEYGESLFLCQMCDGVVLTVKLDDCRVEVLKEAKKILNNANVRIMGAIANYRKFYLPQWLYNRI
jgi:Mrp family chromosome partitioning ATPase